jgi:uncharacterized delta-60 repeat protein
MRQFQKNQQNPQNKSKKLINFVVVILTILIVFTACHKKKKPFLLLPLIDNSSVATTDNGSGDGGSGSGVGSSGDGGSGSGVGSSGDGGSGSGVGSSGDGGSGSGVGSSGDGGSGSGVGSSGDGGSGSGVGSSGDGGSGSGVGSSGNGGSGSGGPTFTPAQGILDDSFGAPNGYILQPVSTGSNSDIGYSLAIDKNGKILLGGYCWDTTISKYAFCIARFNPDGSLDTTFGTSGNGYIIQPIGSNGDYGVSLAIDKNDKILLGGYCLNGSNYDFCVARFKSDGSSLDNTFGTSNSGYIIQPIGTSHDTGYSLKIQPDDNILLGGFCHNGSNYDFCVARFNSNGSLDTSFGTGGYKTISITSGNDYAYSLAIQPNGNILLGGNCNNGSNYDFCIARFK